jgi:cyanophycinase
MLLDRTMPRFTVVVAVSLLVTAGVSHAQSVSAPVPQSPRGHLMIVGGGPRPATMREEFVRLAGGPGSARIVVLPMASADAERAAESEVTALRRLGVDARSLILTREQAMNPAAARELDGVTGVWFPGGVQTRLTAVLRDTPVETALRERYHAGAIIGGTSAGAAIMTSPMLTGGEQRPGGARPLSANSRDAFITIDRNNVVTEPGITLLPGAIVDQHFVRRRRHNRLISLVLENPSLVGLGIDESTALLVGPDGLWRVIGESVVIVYDAREAAVTVDSAPVLGAAGLRMHVLPPGSIFDPRTGRVSLTESVRSEPQDRRPDERVNRRLEKPELPEPALR